MNNKTQRREIDRLCRRIAESFNSDEAINKFKNLLQENPEMLESIEEAIHSLQEEKEILREFEILKRYDLPQVAISQEAFENFVDDVLSKNYQQTPNIVKLGNIDENLAKALDIDKIDVYLTRKQLSHFRLERKDKQALTIDEIKSIPKVIALAQEAFIDTEKQNFTLSFKDEHNIEKINLLHFNADKQGNYIVTAKKMDLSHFQRMKYARVVAGIEPAIHSDDTIHSTKSRGITTQTDKIISQNPNKSQAISQDDGGMALKSIRELEAKRQKNLQTMQETIDKFKKENKVRKI